MVEAFRRFRQARWLCHLTDAQWVAATREASFLSKPADTLVFSQGDIDSSLYYVSKGRVAVIKTLDTGEEKFVRELGPGEFFGELTVLDPAPRSTAIRTTEASEFFVLPRHFFVRCVEENSALAMAVIVDLVRQIRAGDVRLDTRLSVRERLWSTLCEFEKSSPNERATGNDIRVNRAELAMRCHADVKTISRELTNLERAGLIQRVGRRIRMTHLRLDSLARSEDPARRDKRPASHPKSDSNHPAT